MSQDLNSKNFINQHKMIYRNITSVYCPFINDNVFFTMKGFKHLIWKKELGKRPFSIIIERLSSLKYVSEILAKSGTLQEYENTTSEYFAFISIIKNGKYKVVISKDNNKYKFVSIIPKYKTGKRDYI